MKLRKIPEATLDQILYVLNRHREALVKLEKNNVVVVEINREVIAKLPVDIDGETREGR